MKIRSSEKELLDAEEIPTEALYQNLRELESINKLLGGHALNILAFKKLLPKEPQEITVLELASGGGDNLKSLASYCRKQGIKANFTGVDWKADCVAFAQQSCADFPEIRFVCSDYRLYEPEQKADIAFSSLFCHHLSDEEIKEYLLWNQNHAHAFFVNDLHRNPIAEKSIQALTALFSKSYLVKNDAPASVRRGFLREDWEGYLKETQTQGEIYWKWAFRWMILVKRNDGNPTL